MRTAIALLLFCSVALASVNLIYPAQLQLEKGTQAELGKISPGQTLKLIFDRQTGGNFLWDRIMLTPPAGWEKDDAPLTTRDVDSLTVFLRVAEDAAGDYSFVATARNDLGLRSPEEVTFKINVTKNVYSYSFAEGYFVEAGKTSLIPLRVRSESIAEDTLYFGKIAGLPAKWVTAEPLLIAPGAEKNTTISVTPIDEGFFRIDFAVSRNSSSIIDSAKAHLRVKPTLQSKLRAYGEGFSLVPIILQPFYALLSLFGL